MEPFKRSRDKVALVGFAQKTRHMAPFDDPEYEIFGLNEEYNWYPKQVNGVFTGESWLKRYDRWFQLHPWEDFMRPNNTNDRNHSLWLMNKSGTCQWCGGKQVWHNYLRQGAEEPCPYCKDGIFTPNEMRAGLPIYMQQAWPQIPGSVKYPLRELCHHLLPDSMRETGRNDYFTSTPAFMLAFAIGMGYKTIAIYGFEMGTDTEYHYQRACFEYWMGQAHGRGIQIILPRESSLLRGELYGYETLKVGYRQDIEMRHAFMEIQVKNAEHIQIAKEGAYNGLNELLKSGKFTEADVKAAVQKAKLDHAKAQGMANFNKGALQEVELQTKMYDAYYNSETRENVVKTEELVRTGYAFE